MKLLLLLIALYFIAVFIHFFFFFYPKKKMEIANDAVKFIDNYNLEVLKRFSKEELDPESYNKEIRKYKGEFGKRVLKLYREHHIKPFKKLASLFEAIK